LSAVKYPHLARRSKQLAVAGKRRVFGGDSMFGRGGNDPLAGVQGHDMFAFNPVDQPDMIFSGLIQLR
jgi:hypothetical protein